VNGDGVVVVPRAVAEQVAKYANEILTATKPEEKAFIKVWETVGLRLSDKYFSYSYI